MSPVRALGKGRISPGHFDGDTLSRGTFKAFRLNDSQLERGRKFSFVLTGAFFVNNVGLVGYFCTKHFLCNINNACSRLVICVKE